MRPPGLLRIFVVALHLAKPGFENGADHQMMTA
jgi:hypothetical protein